VSEVGVGVIAAGVAKVCYLYIAAIYGSVFFLGNQFYSQSLVPINAYNSDKSSVFQADS